jgi:Holliday junction resolvasome RuvABC endonuclease subunit
MSSSLRILCFDPALTLSGWAVLDLKQSTIPISVYRFGTISPSKLASVAALRDKVNEFSKRLISLALLREKVLELLDEFKPDYIVVEDAFYHPKRPNAYISLMQWINILEMTTYQHLNKPVYRIPTRAAKLCVAGSGDGDKLNIQTAILNRTDIVFKQKKLIENLNEHVSDAIAVGYTFCVNYLPALKSS